MSEFFHPCDKGQLGLLLGSNKRGNEDWQLILCSDATVTIHPDSQRPLRLRVSDGCWAALDMIEWALTTAHQFDPTLKLQYEDALVANRRLTFFVENEAIVSWTITDKPS